MTHLEAKIVDPDSSIPYGLIQIPKGFNEI